MQGRFPSLDLESDDVIDQRRGSVLPSTPWEALWRPIAQWFGVDDARMAEVLPNLPNFPSSMVPTRDAIFSPDASG